MTNNTLKNLSAVPARDWAVLLGLLVLFESVSAAIGFVTGPATGGWYNALDRSSLTPPGWVFAATWTMLYALMAASVWLIWRERQKAIVAPALMLFGLHLLANWSWSFLFFTYHFLLLSFAWIIGLLALALCVFFIFRAIRPAAAWLLAPYLGWLIFEAYLSFYIWRNNPS